MPTSTLWRRAAASSSIRGASPVRPSGDAIERISPEPSFPPTFADTAFLTSPPYRDQNSMQGLGLSHTGLLASENNFQQPEDLYIDRNGGAHVRSRVVATGGQPEFYHSPPHEWTSRSSRPNRSYRSAKSKGHTRSGSTIDDLASAAIATSPNFANGSSNSHVFNGSPTTYSPTRPSTSHVPYFSRQESSYEPPAKRVKSERLPAVEWNNPPSRPTTSYEQSAPVPEEVELLLGLRTEVNFKTQASPPALTAQLHRSPEDAFHAFSPAFPPQPMPKQEETGSSEIQAGVDIRSKEMTPPGGNSELDLNGAESQPYTESANTPDKIHVATGIASATAENTSGVTAVTETVATLEPVLGVKKTRRIKPQVQAEVCAECNKLQRETDDDDVTISWICCNGCNRWFHASCVGIKNKSEARSVDKFVCKQCEPEHGQTTFVRTSSRARTAIDYAGLNQGLVKSSIETSKHHYIQPIKSGKFVIQPDDFARIRPELLTVEFMESFDNMKRPFVVPACWNPRLGAPRSQETEAERNEDKPAEQRFDSNGARLNPESDHPTEISTEAVIDCQQDLLDMVMPRDLTVRKVAELYGSQELVPVIDVKSQETKGTWTLEQWADYYEDPGEKPIRNVISLEVSESRIGRLIRRPKVVRDLDLEDQVWDAESRATQKKRPVQYYCLMSVADSYTDFHIDFGGSSVYYHILKGTKTFFFIPPEDRYLKKYEEWCNSQTQNDTWLPDLCNGTVTRVDLHEGDTAFIPAGWIHSVWTPEDSLVIGGNFLTRIDYELQLKVAHVERVTKVAPKFRYPFFQKVMWYALIKYLEDDPVPEDILEDFQDDPEYTYLRANPVWHEIGDLTNDAEPGSAEFNARCYPKSEIKGLPALRDYLYRTARIGADLPVPDINKKQIEAVKNSIPKGHGDPLALIKTFAIWCAWKTGGAPAPEWVYSDAGGFPELETKIKKAESVRLPGERTSLRRAAQNVSREATGSAVITPYQPGFSAAGVSADPNKKGKPASHKPAGVRTACDACRKRRVRCPHKEGELSPGASEPSPLTRGQSPSVAPAVNGLAPERSTAIAPMTDGVPSLDVIEGLTSVSSNLVQTALATMDIPGNDPNGLMPNGFIPTSGKKSRSKACEECRKSKRRCVHDEYGRVDPAKAAEPSKPRGSSNTKRPARLSDENVQAKRPKLDGEPDGEGRPQESGSIDAMIDPALFEPVTVPPEDVMQVETRNGASNDIVGVQPGREISLPGDSTPQEDLGLSDATLGHLSADQAIVNDATVKLEPDRVGPENATVQQQEVGYPTNSTGAVQSASVEAKPMMQSETPRTSMSPVQRHSSRQPKQVERYIPGDHKSPTKPPPKSARNERRGSSAASGQTIVTSVKSRRSSSNTSGTTHQMAVTVKRATSQEAAVRPVSRGSTAESELDADERLARELQAAEHGLRRRQSMRL